MKKTGTYISGNDEGGVFNAFFPNSLYDFDVNDLEPSQLALLEKANRILGKLDGVAQTLPNLQLFLYFYVRKEALLSSQIEGTQSSLSDFLLSERGEVPGIPFDDVEEVSNYVKALEYGLERMKTLPISLRLIKELHEVLLSGGRGSSQNPGNFRTVQNWIGGKYPSKSVFVPPPVDKVTDLLTDFEKFIHATPSYSALIKTALIHYQFETIHPFLDGNGRIGRLLIILLLIHDEIIEHPILYLSLFFKENRSDYYQRLMDVRTKGDWGSWIEFFLEGIVEVGNQAIDSAKRIQALFDADLHMIQEMRTGKELEVYLYFQNHPVSNVPEINEGVKSSKPTIYRAVKALVDAGILVEASGRERGKIYLYKKYFDILHEGTDPLK